MSEETTEEVVEEIPLERHEMPHACLPVLHFVVECTALLMLSTLLIGQHFKVTTVTVLPELIPTLEARGIELVHASEIVQ
jgi:hypothetical protein